MNDAILNNYQRWTERAIADVDVINELKDIAENEGKIEDAFYKDLAFKTATGLPFRYKLKIGKNGEYNRELLIDRREKSKSLAWSSVVLAFENSKINVFS